MNLINHLLSKLIKDISLDTLVIDEVILIKCPNIQNIIAFTKGNVSKSRKENCRAGVESAEITSIFKEKQYTDKSKGI